MQMAKNLILKYLFVCNESFDILTWCIYFSYINCTFGWHNEYTWIWLVTWRWKSIEKMTEREHIHPEIILLWIIFFFCINILNKTEEEKKNLEIYTNKVFILALSTSYDDAFFFVLQLFISFKWLTNRVLYIQWKKESKYFITLVDAT